MAAAWRFFCSIYIFKENSYITGKNVIVLALSSVNQII